jgi:hypothetical protein
LANVSGVSMRGAGKDDHRTDREALSGRGFLGFYVPLALDGCPIDHNGGGGIPSQRENVFHAVERFNVE